MGTAATAKQMRSLQEESLIPRAIKLLFDTLATIKQEYSVILKVCVKCGFKLSVISGWASP